MGSGKRRLFWPSQRKHLVLVLFIKGGPKPCSVAGVPGPNSGPWILWYRKTMYHRGVILGGRRKSMALNLQRPGIGCGRGDVDKQVRRFV